MTPNIDQEIERLQNEIRERYDRLMCLILEKKYNVKVEIVDDDHIKINEKEMNKEEFMNWLIENGEEELLDRPDFDA